MCHSLVAPMAQVSFMLLFYFVLLLWCAGMVAWGQKQQLPCQTEPHGKAFTLYI